MNFLDKLRQKSKDNSFNEGVNLVGEYTIELFDKNGKLKDREVKKNLITNVGFAELANLAGNVSTPVAFTYLAIGTGTTAAAVTDTTLVTECTTNGLERAAATVSRTTTTVTNDTLQLAKTFTYSGSTLVAIKEYGVFNDSSTGTMLSRTVGANAKNLEETGETLVLTYKLSFASI